MGIKFKLDQARKRWSTRKNKDCFILGAKGRTYLENIVFAGIVMETICIIDKIRYLSWVQTIIQLFSTKFFIFDEISLIAQFKYLWESASASLGPSRCRNCSYSFSSRGTLWPRSPFIWYELPPSFPPRTLTIVFYGRDTLGMMMMKKKYLWEVFSTLKLFGADLHLSLNLWGNFATSAK